MARGENQKKKLIILKDFFERNTDKEHPASMPDILDMLEKNGINAERKSIYTDIAELQELNVKVVKERKGRDTVYYCEESEKGFKLAELKLLVDSVQASKFITAKKSEELIKKLEGLTSKFNGDKLQRQVYVYNRVKGENEEIYKTVDPIHNAIAANKKIHFKYVTMTPSKKEEYKRNGQVYEISPWGLVIQDENYYLVAFDSKEQKIKHFRVDKIREIEVVNSMREGKELFENFDPALYSKKHFSMFDGEECSVKMRCENYLAGVMVDRFGRDVKMRPDGAEHFVVHADIAISKQFLGWVMSLGNGIQIISPQNVIDQMREELEARLKMYKA